MDLQKLLQIRKQIAELTASIPVGGWCDEDGCEGLTGEQSERLEQLFREEWEAMNELSEC
jgi:hypothetical protein